MHVALGALCGTTGGPATYAGRLAAALAERSDLRVTVLTDRPERFAGLRAGVVEVPCAGGADRLLWQHLRLPRALRALRPDLYHDTKNALPWRCAIPAVVTVHDLAYWRCPATFTLAARTFLRSATAHAVRRAQAVVVPSAWTARDLVAIHPRCVPRVHVVPHGIAGPAAPEPAVLARLGAQLAGALPFVLHVGTIQARKHVDLLVRAVRLLRARGLPHRLVLAGRRGWRAEQAFAEIRRDDTALWLGEVDAAELAALYQLADAFGAPSGYEGFGFTVAEAMAAGLPVVVADNSSLPEVVGDAGVRVAEPGAEAFAAALEGVLRDRACATALGAAARARAAGFPWARCADGTVAAYRAALAGSSAAPALSLARGV